MPILVYRPMFMTKLPMAMIEHEDLAAYNDGTPRGYYAKYEITKEQFASVVSKLLTVEELAKEFPPLPKDAPLIIDKAVKAKQSAD